jgi:type IV pilus assembly protein PilA
MLKAILDRARQARATELEGEEAAEAGFTLIELMVVLLIIAILLAIAIPTFLGVTNSANDRATQSNLTNALTEAEAVYQSNNQIFDFANNGQSPVQGTLSSSAPEFTWVDGTTASADQNHISVQSFAAAGETSSFQGLMMAAYSSKTQTCWFVMDLKVAPTGLTGWLSNTTAGTYYAKSTAGATKCKASYPASTTTAKTWTTSYATAPSI